MVKTQKFMEGFKGCFEGFEFSNKNLSDYGCDNTTSHDGSSFDGFISFTDGFVEKYWAFSPTQIGGDVSFYDFDGDRSDYCKSCEKIVSDLADWDSILSDYYDWNKSDENMSQFNSKEEFISYINSSNESEELRDSVTDFYYSYYDDCPAYIGVFAALHDSKSVNGKNICYLSAYINDDLSYKRDSVSYCKSSNGETLGRHDFASKEIEYTDLEDLKAKLSIALESLSNCVR